MALIDKIKAIADAIRAKTGTTAPLTLDEMAESIEYLESDGGGPLETFILVDEDGYEMAATLTEEEVELTATPNDIRIGTTAVTDAGVTTGEKEIPAYYVSEGYRIVPKGDSFVVPSDLYDYTKFQAAICSYNTKPTDSVATTHVALLDNIYAVNSAEPIARITKNASSNGIDLGITNESDKMCIVRYFMFKEMY